ncbi:ABC transporter ATP-binding protein [Amaricoccus solimangrovi]|nr:ABC transporter ATP-binding protein [Amaricoccus solimangrovi]
MTTADIPPAAAQDRKVMVSIRDLSKAYGAVHALKGVDIDIYEGEVLVLLGPSGCGKTTLLRSVAGLEQPTTGTITVRGQTVFSSEHNLSLPPEKRNLSMVFQSYALWPHMTVADNVGYPLRVSKVPEAEVRERVRKILDLTGLQQHALKYPGQMSGGQQQRVALARALVANDGLILFDEPLSNLDAKVRERLRDELIAMQRRFGFTAIYVTHDQVEAAALADRIAVMQVGEVAQLGEPEAIFNEPHSRYVADFVGCVNELSGTVAGWEGNHLAVDTPVGRLLGTVADAPTATGAPVKVMFRPEHGQLRDGPVNGPNSFAASVEQRVFLGSHVEYRLRIGEGYLAARSMSAARMEDGRGVTVSVDPDVVRVFQDAG